MNIITRFLAFGLILSSISIVNRAPAGLVLSFSDDSGASFSDEFSVQTGDSLTVGLYLQQFDGETILTDEGLFSWGLDVTNTSPGIGSIAGAAVNPAFDTPNHDVTTASGFEWEFADSSFAGVQNESILLGTFRYEARNEGTSAFTIEDRVVGPGFFNANWFTPSLSSLDEQIFGVGSAGNYQFTVNSVTAVPEPSSILLFGFVSCALVCQRRRRVR